MTLCVLGETTDCVIYALGAHSMHASCITFPATLDVRNFGMIASTVYVGLGAVAL